MWHGMLKDNKCESEICFTPRLWKWNWTLSSTMMKAHLRQMTTSPGLGEMQTACQFGQKAEALASWCQKWRLAQGLGRCRQHANSAKRQRLKHHGVRLQQRTWGYLRLTPEELEKAQATGIDIDNPEACEKIEYGENRDGYWTGERFICQVEKSKLQR